MDGKLAVFEYKENGEPLEPYLDLAETSKIKIEQALERELYFNDAGVVKRAETYLTELFLVKIRLHLYKGDLVRVETSKRKLTRAERFILVTHLLTGLNFREALINGEYRYGVYYRLETEKRGWKKREWKKGVWREVE